MALRRALSDYVSGYSLSQIFYKDPDIYQAEINKIFNAHWLFAGHVSQLENVGDFFTLEIANESVIITRATDKTLKAYINICRHRGSRLCLESQGTTKLFTCPYHAWSYNLNGELVAARHMEADFKPADYGLHKVALETIGGLIFISLASTPLSTTDMHETMDDLFALFGFDSLKLATSKQYHIPANWKLAVENYQECYHCTPSHKEFAQIHAMAKSPEDFAKAKQKFSDKTKPIHRELNAYFGYARKGQEGYQYGRNPLLAGKQSGSRDGKALAPLLGNLTHYNGGASEFMLGPVNFFLIYDDHMVGYRFVPTGLESCLCEVYWFVNETAQQGVDYDLEKLTWLWDVTTQADKTIIHNNQLGVNSGFYQPGPFSKMESFEQSFIDWYIHTMRAGEH